MIGVTHRFLERAKKKLLYVAMSRPTHLLCLAMNREHVSDEDKTVLEGCGYIVKELTIS